MSLILTAFVRNLMVVTSYATVMVALVFRTVVAPCTGIITVSHKSMAVEKGKVVRLGMTSPTSR
jgi:hypothetical protein